MNKLTSVVLDSYALMVLFHQEHGYVHVERVLAKAKEHQHDLKITNINVGEIFYSIYKSNGSQAAQQALILIEQMSINIVDVNRDLVMSAALVKAQYALSYADAFVVALAQQGGEVILTGDKEFKSVEKIVAIEWIK